MNRSPFQKATVIALVIIVLAGEIAALAYWGKGDWQGRISFILQIIAFYGIGLGFLSRAEALAEVKFQLEGMTSPNIFRFIGDNFWFVGVIFLISSLGIRTRKTKTSAVTEAGGCLFILLFPFIFVYAIFHILVIMPVTYVGYILASALVESVQYSARDIVVEINHQGTMGKFSVREIVARNPVAAKSFLIGIPAAILALIVKFAGLFL